jgi:hypothetical protein
MMIVIIAGKNERFFAFHFPLIGMAQFSYINEDTEPL